ncbi:hypothetical protein BZL30_6205 [Mycobacterium kansasii]|uniref:Uncharacterized protein n=1 Tax=Mycobacterium kansasii TaxID=1768 RepID=A0A1V3WUG3_MYCKA|nr:hypothetical protein BZL30_6205 [Mycobacterium kansasii]
MVDMSRPSTAGGRNCAQRAISWRWHDLCAVSMPPPQARAQVRQ